MNCLVVGGAGFIGKHLCNELIKDNEVTCVDDLSNGNWGHLDKRVNRIERDIYDYLGGDIKYDIIYHLAANSDIRNSDNDVDLQKTFLTTIDILQMMKVKNIKKIVFASSSAVFGNKVNITDNTSMSPISLYGAAKASSEMFIKAYSALYGIDYSIVRFPNVVGEWATHGVLYDLIGKLLKDQTKLDVLGNGYQRKPYIYVKDIVQSLILFSKIKNIEVNIGVEGTTSVRDIVDMLTRAMSISPEITYQDRPEGWDGDVFTYQMNSGYCNLMGFYPSYTSNSAVELAISKLLEEYECRQ